MPKITPKMSFIEEHGPDNPDLRPGHYYVSVLDGSRYALALGPFETHAEALAEVKAVQAYCNEKSDRAWFYGYGTCRLLKEEEAPAGKLNSDLLITA